jgi:hypothetical protein
MAESREQAEKEIKEHTDGEREPHGLCGKCLAHLLADQEYEITKNRTEVNQR